MACHRSAPKSALVRLSAPAGEPIRIGAGPGRGAWLCAGRPSCFDAGARHGALGRALRRSDLGDAEIHDVRARLCSGNETER
ncbi:MAG TPA: YlxR family protein [Acidimicrobiia bacterium]|nr:YlxR family protein [Acidimicrobiia bacterium]